MDDFIEYVPSVAIQSPCVLVCTLDIATNWCLGCGRTGAEIAAWTAITPEERRRVMAMLPERMAALEA